MQKIKQQKQEVDWTDWKRIKNPFWYQRITNALPIYNEYNKVIENLFDILGRGNTAYQMKVLKKMERYRQKVIADVDKIDHKFLNDLYQARLLYLANQKGFNPEKIAAMLKATTKSKKHTRKSRTKNKKK